MNSRWLIALIGVVLTVAGVLGGGDLDVCRKAMFICLECIGIG